MSKIIAGEVKFKRLNLGKGRELPKTVQALALYTIQHGAEHKAFTQHCIQLHAQLAHVMGENGKIEEVYEYQNWQYQWSREDQKFIRVPTEMLRFTPGQIFNLEQ